MLKSPEVRFLQIEPTTRCNFTCKFCRTHHIESGDLPWDTFVKVLDAFPNLEYLHIQGTGEPLLHPQFFEMVKLAKNRGIQVSTITNGSLFSRAVIAKILESQLNHILVSIESPIAEEFKSIRGGNLEKITQGIEHLLQTRQQYGLELPIVGFSLTVMKRNKHLIRQVVDLYQQLNMDGGIYWQFLLELDSFTEIYEPSVSNEMLSHFEKIFVYAQLQKILRLESIKSRYKHPYEELYKSLYLNGIHPSSGEDHSQSQSDRCLTSCPSLESALYIDRQGFVTGCGLIQDVQKYAFGKVDEHEMSDILSKRQLLSAQIQSGQVPPSCRHCFIAESIAASKAKLKHYTSCVNGGVAPPHPHSRL